MDRWGHTLRSPHLWLAGWLALPAACADDIASTATSGSVSTDTSSGSPPTGTLSNTTEDPNSTAATSGDAATTGAPDACAPLSVDPLPPLFPAPNQPFLSAPSLVGDFDGDADLDLITPDSVADGVNLWRGDGAGSLAPPVATPTGLGAAQAASALYEGGYEISPHAADLDGDGDLDLVVAGVYMFDGNPSRYTTVLLNDGSGAFAVGAPVDVTGRALVLGDISGDGRPDLLFAEIAGLTIVRNDGDGTFTDVTTVFPGEASGLAAVDLDGDDDTDVILEYFGEGLTVGLNTAGTLTFGPFQSAATSNTLALGDFDGDGDTDAATVRGRLFIYDNDGAGVFSQIDSGAGLAGDITDTLRVADLDGDGDLDLATVQIIHKEAGPLLGDWTNDTSGLHLLINDGGGVFHTVKHALGRGLVDVAVADLDADGAPDLALTVGRLAPEPSGLLVLRGDGTGVFPRRSYLTGGHPEQIVAADLDADGDLDLVTANSGSGDATILVNDAGAYDRRVTLVPEDNSDSTRIEGVVVADLDGDARDDLALVAEVPPAVWYFRNDGDLAFSPQGGTVLEPIHHPESIAAADLDDDGDLDLVTANGEDPFMPDAPGTVLLLENTGGWMFTPAGLLPVGRGPETVLAVAVDGDADLDLAIAAEDDLAVHVLRGQPGLAFAPPAIHVVPGVPDALVAGDLDGDGRPELIAALSHTDPDGDLSFEPGQTIAVLRNDGTGAYHPPLELSVGLEPRALAVGDADDDGDLDVMVASARSDEVTVLINQDGALTTSTVLPVGTRPMGLILADFDGLCGLDIAVTGKESGDVFLIRSQ